MRSSFFKRFFFIAMVCLLFIYPKDKIFAYDPLSVSNNKFGIHIISSQEASAAANLVNSSGGDWGYVTLLIQSNDKNILKWQEIFNDLRRKHLIPILRLATYSVSDGNNGSFWAQPQNEDPSEWAEFLDKLIWPIANRYVVVYNEPNHASEWGGKIDPSSYAVQLKNTIFALKQKSADFFVLNAGFDQAAPTRENKFLDEAEFLLKMNQAEPGIFKLLDGWNSHSYPNPEFSGSQYDTGRKSIVGYRWEQDFLKQNFGVEPLPVFITETGWVHAEGIDYKKEYPSAEQVAQKFKKAFEEIWRDKNLVTVTPFLLNYSDSPFDHFSWFITSDFRIGQNSNVLGEKDPQNDNLALPQYETVLQVSKDLGNPKQNFDSLILEENIPNILRPDQPYSFFITFKNSGQSIWGEKEGIFLKPAENLDSSIEFSAASLSSEEKIEPGKIKRFLIYFKTSSSRKYKLALRLFDQKEGFFGQTLIKEIEVEKPGDLDRSGKLDFNDLKEAVFHPENFWKILRQIWKK